MRIILIRNILCLLCSFLSCGTENSEKIKALLSEPQTPETLREIMGIVGKQDFRKNYNYMRTTHDFFAEIIPYWKILSKDAFHYQDNSQKIHLSYLDHLRLDLIDNLIEFLTQWKKFKNTVSKLQGMGFAQIKCDKVDDSARNISDIRLGYLMQLMTQAEVILKVATEYPDCKDLLENMKIVDHRHCGQRSFEHLDYWTELRCSILSRSRVFNKLVEWVKQPILKEFIGKSINAWNTHTDKGHEALTRALAFCSDPT